MTETTSPAATLPTGHLIDQDSMIVDAAKCERAIERRIKKAVREEILTLADLMDGWTKRCDDAKRIPQFMREYADKFGGLKS